MTDLRDYRVYKKIPTHIFYIVARLNNEYGLIDIRTNNTQLYSKVVHIYKELKNRLLNLQQLAINDNLLLEVWTNWSEDQGHGVIFRKAVSNHIINDEINYLDDYIRDSYKKSKAYKKLKLELEPF